MQYYIDSKSGIPIYIQLKEQIKQCIVSGSMEAGDRLPTVRKLAVDLTINPNTVSRVYKELEKEGLIKTKRGVGTFVAENFEHNIDQKIIESEIDKVLDKLMTKALQVGIDNEFLKKRFNKKLKEWF